MNRYSKKNQNPGVKPVKKVELSEKNMVLRIVVVVVLIIIAGAAFTYAINGFFSKDSGWTNIEANTGSYADCSHEFLLQYNLGASGNSATVENKALVVLYTDAVKKAYELFHAQENFDGVNNMKYINDHPNEEIVVDPVLYEAFSQVEKYENRTLYLGPVYRPYSNLFLSTDDSQAINHDPHKNDIEQEYVNQVAEFAHDPAAISLELLGDNKICLRISEEYQAYASENEFSNYIDFYWMKNAFIIDYLADVLLEHDYTNGIISSYDGYTRNLDDSNMQFSYNVDARVENKVYTAGILDYTNSMSMVYLSNWPRTDLEYQYSYEWDNGDICTAFVDTKDGMSKTSVNSLLSYSGEKGCADILLEMIPAYIADTLDKNVLENMAEDGVYSIYNDQYVIHENQPGMKLRNLNSKDGVSFQEVNTEK